MNDELQGVQNNTQGDDTAQNAPTVPAEESAADSQSAEENAPAQEEATPGEGSSEENAPPEQSA